MPEAFRKRLTQAKKIVLKIGSSVLTENTASLQESVFERLSQEVCRSLDSRPGSEFTIVSSGAIAAGRSLLKISGKNLSIPQKQAAASVGQSHLIQIYQQSFSRFQRIIGQVLLTHDDLSDRTRYLNARHTLTELLKAGVIPIINENDTVVVEEIKFGDNDSLSALIAPLVEADLLILFTDLDGLYDADPKKNPRAKCLSLVEKIDDKVMSLAGDSISGLGVGGMAAKLAAAKRAASYGISTVIANGHVAGNLDRILNGEEVGTLFPAAEERLTNRKHWIGHTLRSNGALFVDAGAKKVLQVDGKSLLPSGITKIEGDFEMGEAVKIKDDKGNAFAQGLVNYSAKELAKILGKKSSEIEKILGYKYTDEVVHRDDLTLLGSD